MFATYRQSWAMDLVFIAVILVSFCLTTFEADAQTTTSTAAPRPVTVRCTRSTACYPWSSRGPACKRASRMNLRFATTACSENAENVSGIASPVTELTYAFCPIVDELQAINLTEFFRKTAVFTQDAGATWQFGSTSKTYVSAIGFGNQTSRTIPPNGTEGMAMVLDNSSTLCGLGEVGIVNFLILNVSMNNGFFKYLAGHSQPPGSAFMPTCDADDICTVDADQKCIGEHKGRKNCGTCYSDPAKVADLVMQVWVSYYGTDVNGRLLRSGASNPMNFRKYSLGGVYSSLTTAYQNLKNSRIPGPDDLSPPV